MPHRVQAADRLHPGRVRGHAEHSREGPAGDTAADRNSGLRCTCLVEPRSSVDSQKARQRKLPTASHMRNPAATSVYLTPGTELLRMVFLQRGLRPSLGRRVRSGGPRGRLDGQPAGPRREPLTDPRTVARVACLLSALTVGPSESTIAPICALRCPGQLLCVPRDSASNAWRKGTVAYPTMKLRLLHRVCAMNFQNSSNAMRYRNEGSRATQNLWSS